MTTARRTAAELLSLPALWVLAAFAVAFAALTPKFLTADNLTNVLV